MKTGVRVKKEGLEIAALLVDRYEAIDDGYKPSKQTMEKVRSFLEQKGVAEEIIVGAIQDLQDAWTDRVAEAEFESCQLG